MIGAKWSFQENSSPPITVARKTGQTFALAQMALWASVNDMVLVGSNYWTVGTAGTSGLVNASEDEEGESIMRHILWRIWTIWAPNSTARRNTEESSPVLT